MKAYLLAAGHGTRLRPLTDNTPKCLLPVRGVPMLAIWMELCARHGIDQVLVNIHANAPAIHQFLAKTPTPGVNVQVSEEPVLLGSAGTVLRNRDWVAGEECFCIFYSDVLTTASISDMLQFHRRHRQLATLGVYQVPDPRRCGIVMADSRHIVRSFVEKPPKPQGNLAFSGLMIAGQQFLDRIPEHTPCDIGFDVLPLLVGRMAAYHISDYLIDIGTWDNYHSAQRSWSGLPQEETC